MRAVVIAAALRYRDAMRAYLAVQAEAMVQGATLDDLVAGNWQRYQETAQAEAALFALLDTLEATQTCAVSTERHANGRR
jgi:hypothetical protein